MKGSESARLASICNWAWRGLLGLKRRFHPFPRCCNVSPAGFHLPLIDTQGSNERDGKSGRGSGRGGGTQTPLQRFQNTFRVAANEGIRRGELERCQGVVGARGSSEALGCGSVPTLGTPSLWVTPGAPKAKGGLKTPVVPVTPPLCLSPKCRTVGQWPRWSLCPERGGFVPLSLGQTSGRGAPGQSTLLPGGLDAQWASSILLLSPGLKNHRIPE